MRNGKLALSKASFASSTLPTLTTWCPRRSINRWRFVRLSSWSSTSNILIPKSLTSLFHSLVPALDRRTAPGGRNHSQQDDCQSVSADSGRPSESSDIFGRLRNRTPLLNTAHHLSYASHFPPITGVACALCCWIWIGVRTNGNAGGFGREPGHRRV